MLFSNPYQWHKKTITKIIGLVSLLYGSGAMAGLVVIANPQFSLDHLSVHDLENLYLGKPLKSTSKELHPLDQPGSSQEYRNFYKNLLKWGPGQISGYWSSMTFNGEAQQPPAISGDDQAITTVSQQDNAIAYVDSQSLTGHENEVKILYQFDPNDNFAQPKTNQHDHKKSNKTNNKNPSTHTEDNTGSPQYLNLSDLQAESVDETQSQIQKGIPKIEKNNIHNATVSDDKTIWPSLIQNLAFNDESRRKDVQKIIQYFTQPSHRWILQTTLKNSRPYLQYVYAQTQKRHLPAEIALLPMIESSYNPHDYSQAHAAGLWQLIPEVARLSRLKMNQWYDQRLNIVESTRIALNYLEYLHHVYGDWNLALAAYDSGMGTVHKAMQNNRWHHRPTDYWSLHLPKETMQYVPKLLAFAAIIRNADKYGFELPDISPKPYIAAIKIKKSMSIQHISQWSGVPQKVIHQLNPEILKNKTEPDQQYQLLLPAKKVVALEQAQALAVSQVFKEQPEANTSTANPLSIDDLSANDILSNKHPAVKLPSIDEAGADMSGKAMITNTQEQSRTSTLLTSSQLKNEQNSFVKKNKINTVSNREDQQQPISSHDDLKTLVAKIYGKD